MNNIEQLSDAFAKLPGIGKRQAKRIVYYLLRRNNAQSNELASLLQRLHIDIRQCVESYQYFQSNDATENRSPLARDMSRDRSLLMIVEKDTDLESIEKSGAYHGNYFILGGLVPAVETKFNPIRETELLAEIERRAKQDYLTEIIFGLSLNPESEHTRITLTQKIIPLQKEYSFKISQLGRGLSTGTELEYSDSDTLMHAFNTRG